MQQNNCGQNGESMFRSKKRKVSFGSKKRRKYLLEEEEEEESPSLKSGEKEKGEKTDRDFGGGNQSILPEWSFMLFPFSLFSNLTPFQINSRL